jgi:hypothetical protein
MAKFSGKTKNLVWEGLDEYYAELAQLPEACTGEAAHLIEAATNGVTLDIKGAYPSRTGELRNKTTVEQLAVNGRVVGAVVRNTSKHAALFEEGTQARHTALGANRGTMPPGHVFVPRIVKATRALTQQLKDLRALRGAVVTGDA